MNSSSVVFLLSNITDNGEIRFMYVHIFSTVCNYIK